MRRRAFLFGLAGIAAYPHGACAQRAEQVRRVGVLMTLADGDLESHKRLAAFKERMAQLGWTGGRNLRIEIRWGAGDAANSLRSVTELTSMAPEVVLANGSAAVTAILQSNSHSPVVFTSVVDPIGSGFVDSFAKPGRNVTGFTLGEQSSSAKWVELLKEIAPHLKRIAVIRDPTIASGNAQFGAIASAALSYGLELHPVDIVEAVELERSLTEFARVPDGGLIVSAGALANARRDLITALASRHRLPAIYFQRYFVTAGGLMSYGVDFLEQYRQAAGYVDRILRGEKPTALPVQAPTRYELALNLRTAHSLGLAVPPTLLSRADEVIE